MVQEIKDFSWLIVALHLERKPTTVQAIMARKMTNASIARRSVSVDRKYKPPYLQFSKVSVTVDPVHI
jgi:hypothetical protein